MDLNTEIGILLAYAFGMLLLYLPGMPSGLGQSEWIIVAIWTLLGVGMHIAARKWTATR